MMGCSNHAIVQRCNKNGQPDAKGPIQPSGSHGSMVDGQTHGSRTWTAGKRGCEFRRRAKMQSGARRGSPFCAGPQPAGVPIGERSLALGPNGAPATASDGSSLGWWWLERAVSSSSSRIRSLSTRISR